MCYGLVVLVSTEEGRNGFKGVHDGVNPLILKWTVIYREVHVYSARVYRLNVV